MRFSERYGFAPARSSFQATSMDEPLRNGLWNAVSFYVIDALWSETQANQRFLRRLWVDHYKLTVDQQPSTVDYEIRYIRERLFQKHPWYEPYDLIEFVLDAFPFADDSRRKNFVSLCNRFLQREMSAYRIAGGKIARLTTEEEIAAVDEAATATSQYAPVVTHIHRALELLSDRKSPDYRNAIKESISAVESICAIVTGKPKATLGEALKQLEKNGVNLHPALRGAFNQLYGYTSDAQGIRHALLDEATLDFEDAKFMLVSCSAFVNLLRARSAS